MNNIFMMAGLAACALVPSCSSSSGKAQGGDGVTKYVNPLLGTATLWETEDLG